jgi:Membrane-fusion protein
LKYWKVGESTIQAIEQRGTIQESFTITADESGVVTNKRVAVGDYVKLGEPIFDLMNLQKVWVLFDAYEEDLPAIQLGNTIQFTTPAIPNKTFKTRVTFIDPIINPDTRTTAIRTEVDNRAGLLKPAMFVQGSLQQRKSSNTQLSVPKSAVMWTGKRSVVYTRIPDAAVPSFKFKEVQLGESMGDSYQIVEGLEAGDEVVTNGSFTIDAAAQLNNQASMMNKNVGVKGKDTANELPNYVDNTPTAFKKQLTQVAQAYLALKNALVLTKPEAATVEAKTLNNVLQTVEADALEEEATPFWTEQYEAMQAHNSKIIDLSDVEAQRKQFDFLSQALIKAIKVYGITETTLYLQHCPMANNNEGADWLSSEKKIQNPYFGDKMMKCGLVKMSFM